MCFGNQRWGLFPGHMPRASAWCWVGSNCSLHKSQMSLPAPAFSPWPWLGADCPVFPGNLPSVFTHLKALLCYFRLLIVLIFRAASWIQTWYWRCYSLFRHIAFWDLPAHRFCGCFTTFLAFQEYSLPNFKSLLSVVISFTTGIKIHILNGNNKLIHMHLNANMIVFVLQNFAYFYPY